MISSLLIKHAKLDRPLLKSPGEGKQNASQKSGRVCGGEEMKWVKRASEETGSLMGESAVGAGEEPGEKWK